MRNLSSDPNVVDLARRGRDEEALEWVVRLTSGDVTEPDTAAFAAWHEDEANAAAYSKAVLLWRALGPVLAEHNVDAPAAMATEATVDQGADRAVNDNNRRWRQWAAVAAALLLTLGLGNEYATNWRYDYVSGSHRRDVTATLQDGTQVALAPDTALDTAFEKGRRIVSLARGEAFFDVTHDPSHPFEVKVGDAIVRDIGTAFSVRRRDDGSAQVVVARGRVAVSQGTHQAVLTPDRAISFDEERFGPVHAVDASLETAWMRGRLIMENRPLSEVLDELNRFSSRRIVLLDEQAGTRRVNVVVDLNRIDNWLTALGTSQKLSITRLGPYVLVR